MTELLNTLYVQAQGTSLHLDGDTVRVYHPEQTGRKILPLVRIDHIVLFDGVTITQELLLRCADDQRTVSWLTGFGRFRARLGGPTVGNPLLRRAQHQAHENPGSRLTIAQRMVAGKIHNARQALLRAARDITGDRQTFLRAAAQRQAETLTTVGQATDLDALLGAEGTAARDYFAAFHAMSVHSGKPFLRTRRPPTDPLNCLLSFLYGMLRVTMHGALEHLGLDPYIGYLHGIRPGKPALALDLGPDGGVSAVARRPSRAHPAQPAGTPVRSTTRQKGWDITGRLSQVNYCDTERTCVVCG